MAFEFIPVGQFKALTALPEGQVSLGHDGVLRVHKTVLDRAGIRGDAVAVLADAELFRVAVRNFRDEERDGATCIRMVRTGRGVDSGWRRITVRRAIRSLGLETEAVRGRYEPTVKADLIVVALTGERIAAGEVERIDRERTRHSKPRPGADGQKVEAKAVH